jgi:hypothetical protein
MGGVLMSFYKAATSTERGALPKADRRTDTGQWVCPVNGIWTQAEYESCGWRLVVDVARPSSTASDWTRSISLPGGVPTVTWTSRPWTQAELDQQVLAANGVTLRQRAETALAGNAAAIATLPAAATALATATTNCNTIIAASVTTVANAATQIDNLAAEIKRVVTVVEGLTTQTGRVLKQDSQALRLLLNKLDDISDTI